MFVLSLVVKGKGKKGKGKKIDVLGWWFKLQRACEFSVHVT